ncbi:MAG TPA: SPFH domain-containing protein [Pirellulaceae bacterium]|nr:SPFH domain-containing protein [Pirellulaceae bacterium]HMO94119.1 SPFH domain-containing protein [Pirellulaceae bacterium]HMP71046.1 SPFH domain-containing protein [Pirellulaceae bacterium]
MLGFRYLKSPPTRHAFLFKNGNVVRQGAGASFWYFAPTSSVVSVELGSVDVPFVFEDISSDFQDLTIQGQLTYRVIDPQKLVKLLNYTVDLQGRYTSDDPDKLNDRLIQHVQKQTHAFTQAEPLQSLLLRSEELSQVLSTSLRDSEVALTHGLEILTLSVLSIKATPEMAKAMQAEAREQLLLKADQAVFSRRNTAIELERQIKENELNTERAIEEKRREVRQAQMQADVAIELQRAELVDQQVANNRKLADAELESLRGTLEALRSVDWKTLAAAAGGGQTKGLIAMAFQQIAENAHKIGHLNISPDLLNTLLDNRGD